MSSKKKKLLCLIVFCIVIIGLFLLFLLWLSRPKIVLNNVHNEPIEVGDKYKEEGAKAHFLWHNVSSKIKITGTVNMTKPGSYIITYRLPYLFSQVKKRRKVVVVDTKPPVLTLKGDSAMTIYVGRTFYEPGFTATDACNGDLTKQVAVSGSVDANKIGIYTLTYTVKDSSANTTVLKRSVEVKPNPPIGSTIYLTFDDGPSIFTSKILDILKQEQVKATFFLIHYGSNYDAVVKRIQEEGHTLALHSYTHNYEQVYQSESAYFDDLMKIGNQVKETTGIVSKIIRFPGGSSNTVSRFNPGIMSRLTKQVLEKGYHYFDWNVSSGDAEWKQKSPDQILDNVVHGLTRRTTNVVLMHDSASKKTTVEALQRIIQYGKQKGYRFDRITDATPEVAHRISN